MSVSEFERSYEAFRTSFVAVRLSDERALAFHGDDRLSWLQGQVTRDIASAGPGTSAGFCMCSPTGQLLTVGRLAVLPDRVLAVTPAATIPDILARVEDAVFMEDVSVELLADREVWTVQGPDSRSALPASMDVDAVDLGEAIVLRHSRTGAEGFDIVSARGRTSPDVARSATEGDMEAYRVARLEAGTPIWGVDMDRRALPAEMGERFESEHVSYGKGCYTGQEVVMRMHSRGHANRKWVGLIAESELHPGDTISGAGAVTSAGRSPELGFIAGAIVRTNAVKEGEIVTVITPTANVRAEVRPMPLLRPA